MDTAEIARLRASTERFRTGRLTLQGALIDRCLRLLDALEQARKERDEALYEVERCRDRLANIGETTVAPLIVQRDAAQQSAKDARALAYEDCAKMIEGWGHECGRSIAAAIRARIEAFLEPKV